LEDWVRRIAAAYGVSYDAFLKHALGRTECGARDLDRISDAELIPSVDRHGRIHRADAGHERRIDTGAHERTAE